MTDNKVIQFRPRPPSKQALAVYEQMTKRWSSQMRQLIFPRHFAEQDKETRESSSPGVDE